MAVTDARQAEAVDVLGRLVRFKTVNPPGDERALQAWLRDYLTEAGLECELVGVREERPNLVARLRGEAPGPVLGYLSHVDTVVADAQDWRHDPWSGEVHDGFLWGRGSVDMKSQTAAEAVALARLARSGWRPARGEVKLMSVVDEEVGSYLGAKWLCEERPDLVRCDWLLNEGGGAAMRLGDRRLYGVCCAEKGTYRFSVSARGRASHASVPALGENALLKLLPVLERLATHAPPYDLTEPARALLHALDGSAHDPGGTVARVRALEPRLAALVEPMLGVTFAPTMISASEQLNVIPARAELRVDCRIPPGMTPQAAQARVDAAVGEHADELEVGLLQVQLGNASPVASPLMDALRGWIEEQDPEAEVVPTMLPAFTDSMWFREAFPECVAYGFFPQRHQAWVEAWPLMHGADERIDVRDLAWATECFEALPGRLLG